MPPASTGAGALRITPAGGLRRGAAGGLVAGGHPGAASFKRYRRSQAVTAYKEFPERSHCAIGEPGWEQDSPELPDWQTSWRHLTADGQVAELTQPSPANQTRAFPPPVETS